MFERQRVRGELRDRLDAEARPELAAQQVVQDLPLRGEPVLGGLQLVAAPEQARVDLERVAAQHRLLRLVLRRDPLRLGERLHRLPQRVDRRLRRHEVEVRAADLGGDLLALGANALAGDLAPELGRLDAEVDLVELRQRLIDRGRDEARELRLGADLGVGRRDRPRLRVGAEGARREREVEGLQQRAGQRVDVELRQSLAADDVHLVLGLLRLER